MANYSLIIDFDSQSAEKINRSDQQVTIVKKVVTNPEKNMARDLVWVTFKPLEHNVVDWVEDYYLFATTKELIDGATVTQQSNTPNPVQDTELYDFANGVFKVNFLEKMERGWFGVHNLQGEDQFSFGVSQATTVNGVTQYAPLNAVPILNNEIVKFQVTEQLSIFLSGYRDNGTVVSSITSQALNTCLSTAQPSKQISFRGSDNTFIALN